jgi:hypothetical protein
MNPRSIDLALTLMDARAFEDLVFALVRVEHPTAVQLTPPDAGRDTIVPGEEGRRERAWQAKHHTAGIKWADCEASVITAVTRRDPEEVTFVFPVMMTEGKEDGLRDLRKLYPEEKVRVAYPWTADTLREKLLAQPEIRCAHIDHVLGLDAAYAEEMFRRGAQEADCWSQQTAAALQGPLAVHEAADAFERAESTGTSGF